ncbi:hypothetical protein KFL_000780020 [Klebsormidium nitens]|uniref:Uncharacterized protein n=1 Tax=Klebsormidium nitens TaxID=105231 RepID=A0A1Y1HRT2_KLENI|nr:hypothetical protein KFL_000780020 [Klebsormidium nitens]|eukprot:GAQ81340.1 hypothetical protein KFL_000780020 [Klebsormidium nitens]
MAALFDKSRTWRRIVALGKASPAFFWGFTATTVGAAGLLAYLTQKATTRNTDEFREELLKRGRKDAVLVNSANKERLGQLLKEIQQKDDFEDRYKAALNGETLTGTPGARMRGGSGTSATPEWVAKATEAQRLALEKEKAGAMQKVVESSSQRRKQNDEVKAIAQRRIEARSSQGQEGGVDTKIGGDTKVAGLATPWCL